MVRVLTGVFLFSFFFNDTATTEIYTLSLHDALPISSAASNCMIFRRNKRGMSDRNMGIKSPLPSFTADLHAAPINMLLLRMMSEKIYHDIYMYIRPIMGQN